MDYDENPKAIVEEVLATSGGTGTPPG